MNVVLVAYILPHFELWDWDGKAFRLARPAIADLPSTIV